MRLEDNKNTVYGLCLVVFLFKCIKRNVSIHMIPIVSLKLKIRCLLKTPTWISYDFEN